MRTMTQRPQNPDFGSLTPTQLNVLCNVAFGGNGMSCNRRTLEALEQRGLIESVENESADRFGKFTWRTWRMPLHLHIEFCAWCDANFEEVP